MSDPDALTLDEAIRMIRQAGCKHLLLRRRCLRLRAQSKTMRPPSAANVIAAFDEAAMAWAREESLKTRFLGRGDLSK